MNYVPKFRERMQLLFRFLLIVLGLGLGALVGLLVVLLSGLIDFTC